MIVVNFGANLKALRLQHKQTQKELAERLGLVPGLISQYESGDRYPSLDSLAKIAAHFHVTTDYLLGVNVDNDVVHINLSGLRDKEKRAILRVINVMIEVYKDTVTE